MRIVAGEWGGRRLKRPADDRVRPTADRVREAWMSIVQADLPGARVLDLFAGSGALGLEALSRGAVSAHFVEIAPRSMAALAANVDDLGADDRAVLHRADALKFIAKLDAHAFDVAFADPPIASVWRSASPTRGSRCLSPGCSASSTSAAYTSPTPTGARTATRWFPSTAYRSFPGTRSRPHPCASPSTPARSTRSRAVTRT